MISMGLLSYFMARDAHKRTDYLEDRVIVLEAQVGRLEREIIKLRTTRKG